MGRLKLNINLGSKVNLIALTVALFLKDEYR